MESSGSDHDSPGGRGREDRCPGGVSDSDPDVDAADCEVTLGRLSGELLEKLLLDRGGLEDEETEMDDEEDDIMSAGEGAPAADDVIDLVVLDVDDEDLGDDNGEGPQRPQSRCGVLPTPPAPPPPAPPAQSTGVAVAVAIMSTDSEEEPANAVAMAAEAGEASEGAEETEGERQGQGQRQGAWQGQKPAEYYKGLGERLEPFAQLAVPIDSQDQSQIRARLTAIERFREDNVAAMAEDLAAPAPAPLWGKESGQLFCRICRDTDEYNKEPVVSPCQCRGSVARVHMSCLERWLADSDSSCCELCGHQYMTVRTPRYNILTSIPAWMINTGSTDLIFDLVAFLIFTPVALFGTHLGVNADDSPYFQVTLMAAIDLVYSAWLVMRLHYHTIHWYSWWRRKSTVKVILDPDSKES